MKVVRGCVDLRVGQEEQATYTGEVWASGELGALVLDGEAGTWGASFSRGFVCLCQALFPSPPSL